MAPHSVRRHLRVEIEAYDRTIRAFIPAYEEMLERTAEAVAEAGPGTVTDLGAGTGALAQAVLRRCEGARVLLIDADPEMLAQAQVRLAPFAFAARVQYAERPFQGPLPPCDLAVASLALHHVSTLAEKRKIFGAIHAALPPDGVFVNADATMPADPAVRQADYETWAAHLVSCGIDEERAWEHFREWSGEDTYFPLEEELAALEEAGFDVDCLWRAVPLAVVRAVKPARK